MYKEAELIFLHFTQPLHAGGGGGSSYVDLPIQRDCYSGFPIIQDGTIKGAFRDWGLMSGLSKQEMLLFFGPDTDDKEKEFCSLSFTEARILLFPVHSFRGTFAWVTCPSVLEDLAIRWNLAYRSEPDFAKDIGQISPTEEMAYVTGDSLLAHNGQVILDHGLTFDAKDKASSEIAAVASFLAEHALYLAGMEAERFMNRLAVVHDETFRDFVKHSCRITPHIKIGEQGTVASGALWSEESLPDDTVMFSLVLARDFEDSSRKSIMAGESLKQVHEILKGIKVPQVGGSQTFAYGMVNVRPGNGFRPAKGE